jgi:hypothetical protein
MCQLTYPSPPTLSFIVAAIVIHQLEDSIIFCGNHAGKDLFLCCVLFSMVMVKSQSFVKLEENLALPLTL